MGVFQFIGGGLEFFLGFAKQGVVNANLLNRGLLPTGFFGTVTDRA